MFIKGIALEELGNEDYMTQAAKGYPNIPKGAEVEYIDMVQNMYGVYMKVLYGENLYYVNPRLIELK